MPDCSLCSQALGHARRRCKKCGACEDCCRCYGEEDIPVTFTPAELGLDPEDEIRYLERSFGDAHHVPLWRGRRRHA